MILYLRCLAGQWSHSVWAVNIQRVRWCAAHIDFPFSEMMTVKFTKARRSMLHATSPRYKCEIGPLIQCVYVVSVCFATANEWRMGAKIISNVFRNCDTRSDGEMCIFYFPKRAFGLRCSHELIGIHITGKIAWILFLRSKHHNP